MPKIPVRRISQLIQQQFPQNIRENYETFISFIRAYYEWMETNGQVTQGVFTVHADRDVDRTIPAFMQYFAYEFLPNIPSSVLANKALLIKHIKEFYRARGTEKSYQFLFRILYNEDVSFYFPKVDLLKPSNGTWTVDTVVRSTTFNNTFDFIGLTITGVSSGATAGVENVIQFQIGSNLVSEIYISSITGTFELGEKITCVVPNVGTFQEQLYNLVSGVTITNPGLKYAVGDIIPIDDSQGTDAVVVVNQVTGFQTGRVVDASNTFIQNPGPSQVILPPFIQLTDMASAVDNFYQGMTITITDGPGSPQTKTIISYTGVSQIAIVDSDWTTVPTIQNHYSISLGQIQNVEIKNFGINYTTDTTADFTQSGNGEATGTPVITAVATYPGRWLTSDGFLSDIKKIQDSFFWQDFSYVLKAQDSINQYVGVVKSLLHPAGTILFGDVTINTDLTSGPDFRTFERHKFRFAPYQGFVLNYPAPNANYWTPNGPPNTPIYVDGNIINGDVDSLPFSKRNQLADCYISITDTPQVIPNTNEIVEYDCIQGSNPQILYDVHNGVPLHNGIFGSSSFVDNNDPSWGT